MTAFFSSLVDRAIGSAPVLERRRPSLFEPRPGTRVGAVGVAYEWRPDEPHEVGIAEISEIPDRPVVSRDAVPLEPLKTRTPAAPLTEANPTNAPVHVSNAKVTLAAPENSTASEESHREPTPQDDEKKTVRRELTPSVRVIETIIERKVERSRIDDQPAVTPKAKEPTPAFSSPDAPTRSPLNAAPAQPLQPVENIPQKTEVKITPRAAERRSELESLLPGRQKVAETRPLRLRPLASEMSARVQPSFAREASLPAPTIQVTIGRIEIRATPPPSTPVRAARSATPKLNLDDYLRSRNGGGK